VISGAQQFIQAEFQVPDWTVESIVSALLWGAVAGTWAAAISPAISGGGRRYSSAPSSLSLARCFVRLPECLCLIGADWFSVLLSASPRSPRPLYLSEISPQSVRGSMISMYQLMITIGIVIAFVSDAWLASYATFGGITGGHWRIMLGIIALPALIMFIGVLFLPESPRWLFLKGRKGNALECSRA